MQISFHTRSEINTRAQGLGGGPTLTEAPSVRLTPFQLCSCVSRIRCRYGGEWVSEWVSEWVNEWVSEWVSEWALMCLNTRNPAGGVRSQHCQEVHNQNNRYDSKEWCGFGSNPIRTVFMGFKDLCSGVPSKFVPGSRMSWNFPSQKRSMSGNAYEHSDFPAVGWNIHKRRTDQPAANRMEEVRERKITMLVWNVGAKVLCELARCNNVININININVTCPSIRF